MKQYETTKSYNTIKQVYEHLFDKMDSQEDTIFEYGPYRPPVKDIYSKFVADQTSYNKFISLEESEQIRFAREWVLRNVFEETLFEVEQNLMDKYDSLPYNIEYKLNKTHEVITEFGFIGYAAIAALYGLVVTQALPDFAREKVKSWAQNVGKFLGDLATLNNEFFGAFSSKKEIIHQIKTEELVDGLKECAKINGFDPSHSNKIGRFVRSVSGDQREYRYAKCIAMRSIEYYGKMVENVYKLLSSRPDFEKAAKSLENVIKSKQTGTHAISSISRLIRDRKMNALIKGLQEVSNNVNGLIEAFSKSKDISYITIGQEASRAYDIEMNRVYSTIFKSKSETPMNSRNEKMVDYQKGEKNNYDKREFSKDFIKHNNNNKYSNSDRNRDNSSRSDNFNRDRR